MVKVRALCDLKGYKKGSTNDYGLVQELWALLDEADFVIAHNADRFDILESNTRFVIHGLTPPSPYSTIDTLKIARGRFHFKSNKLDDLGRDLGVGRKIPHTGAHLWFGCMSGDKKSWALMKRYNKQDVFLLEKVYEKLRPWGNHPNINVPTGRTGACPACGSFSIVRRGHVYTRSTEAQRYVCINCGKWSSDKPEPLAKKITIK